MMTALDASASSTSLSLMPPTARVDHADAHLAGVGLGDGLGERFDRALHIGLDDQIDGLDLLGLHGIEEGFEGDAIGAGQVGFWRWMRLAFLGDGAGAVEIIHGIKLVARQRQCAESADDDGRAGAGFAGSFRRDR